MDETGPVEISARAEYDPAKRFEVPTWFEIEYRYADGRADPLRPEPSFRHDVRGQDGIIHVDRGRLQCTLKRSPR